MFETIWLGIVLSAFLGIFLAILFGLAVFIYTFGLFAYLGFNNVKYYKDFEYKREVINSTRLYKSIFTRKPVEFL